MLGVATAFSSWAQGVSIRWEPIGAAPTTAGQVENIPDGEVVGAIQSIAPHPVDPNVLYAGAVNGGVWRTENATDKHPSWRPLLGDATPLSIGALEFDPTDPLHKTLVAGFGHYSSYSSCDGGDLAGILRTTDGGTNWIRSNLPASIGQANVSSIAARGSRILVGAKPSGCPERVETSGIYAVDVRTDVWQRISGDPLSGLPTGAAFDVVGDPKSPDVEYAFIEGGGVYRTKNAGVRWEATNSPELAGAAQTASNARLATVNGKYVFAALVSGGELSALFGSSNSGDTWIALDLPSTKEKDGHTYGIHVGGQGESNLSIAADPNRPGVVYLGGDRQPAGNDVELLSDNTLYPDFPNSLGALTYSGRLFRVDMNAPSGSQAAPLTHLGTAGMTAPHADSRSMRLDATGTLIESDDGGIYRRTLPLGKGDWLSLNGDLQVSEFFSVAWDPVSRLLLAGAQDTGAPEELAAGKAVWKTVRGGDGGFVAADRTDDPNHSVWYMSSEGLDGFSRLTFDGTTGNSEEVPLKSALANARPPVEPQFYSPIVVNAIQHGRLLVAGKNGLYESRYEGDSFIRIGPDVVPTDANANAIAYGGAGNAEAIYAGARDGAGSPRIFVRTDAKKGLAPVNGPSGLGEAKAICLDPNDASVAYVADTANVFRGTNYGATWVKITGALGQLSPGPLTSCAYVHDEVITGLLIGSSRGVFLLPSNAGAGWMRFGTGLPQVIVTHLQYSHGDRLLVAGTLGRGAWIAQLKSSSANVPAVKVFPENRR
jgi:photosystem II stability/assembly factor-like uncharacterized protein